MVGLCLCFIDYGHTYPERAAIYYSVLPLSIGAALYFASAVLLYNCWLLVDVLMRDVQTVMAYEPEVTVKRVAAAMTQYLRSVT